MMQLYVMVECVPSSVSGSVGVSGSAGVSEPQFHEVACSCDTSLRSALENTLGGDLTLFHITGPGDWVTWDTSAERLKVI